MKDIKLQNKDNINVLYDIENFSFENNELIKYTLSKEKSNFVQKLIDFNKHYKLSDTFVIRISKTEHLSIIERIDNFLKNISAIEYGAIAKTEDLINNNIFEISKIINTFCKKNNFKFLYATPEILSDRDFERVYTDIKKIFTEIKPDSIVINNQKYLYKFLKDKDSLNIKIEIGSGIELKNIQDSFPKDRIDSIDLSKYNKISVIEKNVKQNTTIKNKKYLILGKNKILSTANCPLNTSVRNGLNCSAPCTKNIYYFKNLSNNKIYPFITDGFCNTHIYQEKFLNLFKYQNALKKAGINEFIIDLSSF